MDKHLNLFYSYNQGRNDKQLHKNQLEDNLTRALIVTLRSLDHELQQKFLQQLVDQKLNSKSFEYDLQNTDKYVKSQKSSNYIIILQRDQGSLSVDNLPSDMELISKIEKDASDLKLFQKTLKEAIKNDTDFIKFKDFIVPHSQFVSLYECLLGNRPDAWIIGDKETFLFESKIGNNTVSPHQAFRHITGKNGLQINATKLYNKTDKVEFINITWEKTCKILLTIAPEKQIVKEYNNYITMTGQKLDFNYILENKFDSDLHKEQMELFLNKLDKKLKEQNSLFEREKRNKSGLWDTYGLKKEGTLQRDPHFTVEFKENAIVIYLTTLKSNQIKNEVVEKIKEYVKEKGDNKVNLSRYYISQGNYKLVDHQKGQIRGELQVPFEFYIKFSEIIGNEDSIGKVLVDFSKMKLYKQFELGLSVDIFDFNKIREENKETQIRYHNRELMKNPENLVSLFIDFMNETKHILEEMKNK